MDFENFIARQANHFVKELLREGLSSKTPRKDFSKKTQKWVLIMQSNRCKKCNRILDEFNFDHIDGNRANNLASNCQALCPNCHAKKTRRKRLGS